jgi:hypothetical protein
MFKIVSGIRAHVGPVFEMGLDIRLQVGLVPEKVLGVRPYVGPLSEIF